MHGFGSLAIDVMVRVRYTALVGTHLSPCAFLTHVAHIRSRLVEKGAGPACHGGGSCMQQQDIRLSCCWCSGSSRSSGGMSDKGPGQYICFFFLSLCCFCFFLLLLLSFFLGSFFGGSSLGGSFLGSSSLGVSFRGGCCVVGNFRGGLLFFIGFIVFIALIRAGSVIAFIALISADSARAVDNAAVVTCLANRPWSRQRGC